MRVALVLLISTLVVGTNCVAVGTIKQAQLITNASSIWLTNQSTWSQCLCYALRNPSFVVFNHYALNSSCQLFRNLSSRSYQIVARSNVTVRLLRPLSPYAPCCSNLTWLMSKLQARVTSLSMPSITSIDLDEDDNVLSVVASAKLSLVSLQSFAPLNRTLTLPAGSQTVNFHDNLLYVGIFPVAAPLVFNIYSADNLTKIGNLSFTQGGPQRLTWLFNDTVVCILIQTNSTGYARANFYNWPANSLNKSVLLTINNAYGLAKAPDDDTFVFIADGSWGGSVWQLRTSAPYDFTLFAASTSGAESPTSLTVDGCDRLWVAFAQFGVRIYDVPSRSLLFAWNLSTLYPLLYDLELTKRYQLYLADKSSGTLARYGTELQCTD